MFKYFHYSIMIRKHEITEATNALIEEAQRVQGNGKCGGS